MEHSRIARVRHCTLCGDDRAENVSTHDDDEVQGCSRCCSELVIDECDEHCSHSLIVWLR